MLNRIWAIRLGSAASAPAFRLAWHALSIGAVIVLPLRLAQNLSFWNASAADAAYSLTMAAAYAVFALGLEVSAGRRNGVRAVIAAAAGVTCYGAALFFLLRHPSLRHAGVLGAAASCIGVPLAIVPFVVHRVHAAMLAALAIAVAVLLVVPSRREAPPIAPRIVETALQPLTITTYADLIASPSADGGSIASNDGRLIVITGDGTLYELTIGGDGGVSSTRVDVQPPFDRKRFLADQPDPAITQRLRVTDLLIEPGSKPARIYVSHQNWNPAGRCLTIRVSSLVLGTAGSANRSEWNPLFDSSPCLAPADLRDDSETGGSLAWLDGRLLLTIGDHGYDGRTSAAFSQLDGNGYGKVVTIDPVSGAWSLFTKGHRNSQGLVVDSAGRVWLTEHGPSGGDELNLLEAGNNYGWPYATYGADYGTKYWPLAPSARNHGAFAEPVYAFVPSVAVASVIEVTSPRFPRWQGDLLVGSLRTRSLFRVRMRDARVVYVEPIPVGREVRDLAEGSDGRLFLWTDDGGDVLTIAPAPTATSGPASFVRCGQCHEAGADGARAAPSLRGIVGHTVADESGFSYSPALAALGGRWTDDRLDAFLADPAGYAPGSRMDAGRVPDAAERRAIIEFLKAYR